VPIDDPGWGDYTPPPQNQPPPAQQSPRGKKPLSEYKLADYKESLSGLKNHRGKLGKLNEKQMIGIGIAVVLLILVAGLMRSRGGDDEKPASAKGGAVPAGAAAATQGGAAAGGDTASGSQDDFASKVDAVCKSYHPKVQEAGGQPTSDALGAVHTQMIAEIKAVGAPPSELAATFQTFVTNYEQAAQKSSQGDAVGASPLYQQAFAAATQLGAPNCG
jgi:hypothetical protein